MQQPPDHQSILATIVFPSSAMERCETDSAWRDRSGHCFVPVTRSRWMESPSRFVALNSIC